MFRRCSQIDGKTTFSTKPIWYRKLCFKVKSGIRLKYNYKTFNKLMYTKTIDRKELERLALDIGSHRDTAPPSIRVTEPNVISCYNISGRIREVLVNDQSKIQQGEDIYINNWGAVESKGLCRILNDSSDPILVLKSANREKHTIPFELAYRVILEYLDRDMENLFKYGIFGNTDNTKIPMCLIHPYLAYTQRVKNSTSSIVLLLSTPTLLKYRKLFLDPRSVIPVFNQKRGYFVVGGLPKEAILAVYVE